MDDGRLREVYAAAYARLVGQLVGVTGDPAEAEDVVMEAFARAATRHSSFHEADNPEAWLRTVAVNVARSRWRRMLRRSHLIPRLVAPEAYADLVESDGSGDRLYASSYGFMNGRSSSQTTTASPGSRRRSPEWCRARTDHPERVAAW